MIIQTRFLQPLARVCDVYVCVYSDIYLTNMEWALSTLCREACLHVGEHLLMCRRVQFSGCMPSLYTWRCEGAVFVVLTKLSSSPDAPVLVYVCDDDVVYFAKPGLEFEGADALIGQFVVDRARDGGQIGRLLVFDVACEGTPKERHARLQELRCGPLINKQWCGDRAKLTPDFLKTLPHRADGVVGLTMLPFLYCSE